jgi:hypothetical protein
VESGDSAIVRKGAQILQIDGAAGAVDALAPAWRRS